MHIIQRGNNRSACFHHPEDFRLYLRHLGDLAARHGCAIHAYVLMTNHVHLLLTSQEAYGSSMLMKHLGQRYVQYFNRRYGRSGTLWEGRFRSCLTQSENYVLRCYRYIELNPVRAEIVNDPLDYRWSSYASNADGQPDALITPHESYLGLGASTSHRRDAYRALVQMKLNEQIVTEIRQATNGNYALGDQGFQSQIANTLGRRAIRGKAGNPFFAIKAGKKGDRPR